MTSTNFWAFTGFTKDAVVSASYVGDLNVYKSGTWEHTATHDCGGMVSALAVSPDRRWIVTAA